MILAPPYLRITPELAATLREASLTAYDRTRRVRVRNCPALHVCDVYWGSHGCDIPWPHDGPHVCGHPDDPRNPLCSVLDEDCRVRYFIDDVTWSQAYGPTGQGWGADL